MREVSQEAAEQKAQEIAALAKQQNAELVTGDPEFKAVEKEIKINWLNHPR